MFKENTFYRVTRIINNREADSLYLNPNDVVLVTKCVESADYSLKGVRFIVDLMFDHRIYERVQWDKTYDYLLEEIL